jgi:nitroreductase
MHQLLRNAIYTAQKAQRNYDLSKNLPEEDIKLLLYAATNCPSKQNEIHYKLHVFTDRQIIDEIYYHTKHFSLFKNDQDVKEQFSDEGGVWKFDKEKCVRNSQVKANILFVYEDYNGIARGGDHILATNNPNSVTRKNYERSKDNSIGISVGQLILTANLLGYRSGICSGFDGISVKKIINARNPVKLLVGLGFENKDTDRRLHPDVYNRDVDEEFRTDELEKNWQFPSFSKTIPVNFNGLSMK